MIFGDFGRHFEIGQLKDATFSMQNDTLYYQCIALYYLKVSLIFVILSQLLAMLQQYTISVLNRWYENTSKGMLVIRGVLTILTKPETFDRVLNTPLIIYLDITNDHPMKKIKSYYYLDLSSLIIKKTADPWVNLHVIR